VEGGSHLSPMAVGPTLQRVLAGVVPTPLGDLTVKGVAAIPLGGQGTGQAPAAAAAAGGAGSNVLAGLLKGYGDSGAAGEGSGGEAEGGVVNSQPSQEQPPLQQQQGVAGHVFGPAAAAAGQAVPRPPRAPDINAATAAAAQRLAQGRRQLASDVINLLDDDA
jgi:hypothetical protein